MWPATAQLDKENAMCVQLQDILDLADKQELVDEWTSACLFDEDAIWGHPLLENSFFALALGFIISLLNPNS